MTNQLTQISAFEIQSLNAFLKISKKLIQHLNLSISLNFSETQLD